MGKRVEVRGSTQPTVEGDGTMMSVAEVIVLNAMSSSEASSVSASSVSAQKMCGGIAAFSCDEGEVCVDDPTDSCDPKTGGADCSGVCVTVLGSSEAMSSSVSSVASPQVSSSIPVKSSSSASSIITSSEESSSVSSANSELEEQIILMMKQTYDQSNLWTQKYCTSHIAFCVPVHKNWYFKSFGATTSNSWHVEFGMMNIEELGQGAITLNLVSGTSASVSAANGQVKDKGSDVIGYKDWNDGDHFEIIADARLRAAVAYMISNISAYELAQ